MRCLNCLKDLPKNAKVCPHCAAAVEPEASPEEMESVRDFLSKLPPDTMAQLHELLGKSGTAEEFADRILVGDCPKCGSDQTGNCEHDPEIDNLLVGRCYACGQLFCTECESLLKVGATECPCLDEGEDEDDDSDED